MTGMTGKDILYLVSIAVTGFGAVFVLIAWGSPTIRALLRRELRRMDLVLNHQLLLDIPPLMALGGSVLIMLLVGMSAYLISASAMMFLIGCGIAMMLPHVIIRHLEEKRRRKLDEQIIDGSTSLASGVRAGLNLVQSIELLVRNSNGPLQQEFQQLLREYELGIDLPTAMRNTSNRIGSSFYRLLFVAVHAHRERGGDMGQSLDRISESIREIQRLDGRLDALTAQGRAQARFMAAMPIAVYLMYWFISPSEAERLLTEPTGRMILLFATALIVVGFVWIRRIMAVDI